MSSEVDFDFGRTTSQKSMILEIWKFVVGQWDASGMHLDFSPFRFLPVVVSHETGGSV